MCFRKKVVIFSSTGLVEEILIIC